MKNWLSPEGPVFGALDKAGQMVMLSMVWLLGCLPLVTVIPATTALYYAVMKSVRRGRGDALKEFWSAYRKNWKRGILMNLAAAGVGALLWINIRTCAAQETRSSLWLGNVVLLVLVVMIHVYVCPVLSRFDIKTSGVWKLSFVMSIRFFPYTLVIAGGTAVLIWLQLFVLPIPTVVILPSVWCLVTTFMTEKALRKFMPEKRPEDDAWYYE